jgi:cell division protein ZapA (FtsZ GTPase activity inhibitor)
MPYLFVGVIIASFASGYGLSSALNKAELIKMHISIDAMNREAEWTLAALTKEADKAHEEALKLNKELEDANVSALNAINSQHDSFKSVRMYDNSRKSSSCTATKGDNTNSAAGADEDRAELSDELTSFLKSEAYRADQIAQYAILCQKFVVVNNCGIPK